MPELFMRRVLNYRLAAIGLLAIAGAGGAALGQGPVKAKAPADAVGKPQAKLAIGEPAPEIMATTLDSKPISLAGLRGIVDGSKAKIVVLQFGSMTEPVFRSHIPAVEKLANTFGDRVNFVIVYGEEAHPADTGKALAINTDQGFSFSAPTTLAEREGVAHLAIERLNIKKETVIVDAWNNTTALRYGSYPNMTFIIDAKGNLQAFYPWMDPPKVQAALNALLADKPLSPELKGSIRPSGAAPLDVTGAAMDMAGGRGPGQVALALDRLNLTEAQRQVLMPAIANYMADLQKFRQTRASMMGQPARGGTSPAANRGNQTNGDKKAATREEVQVTQDSLREAAQKLKALIKETLNEEDAAQLLKALEGTQAQRLFMI
jgi:hypothetical protein